MNSRRCSRVQKRLLLATAALASLPSVSRAVVTYWTFNGSGNWSVASNWNNGAPGAASDAALEAFDAINRTINYDYGGASIQFNSLTIANNSGSAIFSQSANTFNCAFENIAHYFYGPGYWQMTGGLHNVSNLTFGSGTYSGIGTLSG